MILLNQNREQKQKTDLQKEIQKEKMNSFKIQGGTSLSGTITPQGAKNEALQIICAVLLTGEKITIKNIPDIRDIRVLIDLIKKFGVEVNQLSRNDFEFKSEKVNLNFMQSDEFYALSTKIRGSIMIMGPLLARFQKHIFLALVAIK